MENKFAFIICSNNEQYLQECIHYIDRLHIPQEYEAETIVVSDATSMTAGYNAAMKDSDAKYKVYLHQDVFLLNPDFLMECLEIFESDPHIGLIGTLGASKLPRNASAFDSWDVGSCLVCNGARTFAENKTLDSDVARIVPVEAVDGMLMITSSDICWREDLFDSFDFYDVSQSLEFSRAGYKVVVPQTEEIWCLHDCGNSRLTEYDEYRKIFCKIYGDRFEYDGIAVVDESRREAIQLADLVFQTACNLLDHGMVEEGLRTLREADPVRFFSNDLRQLCLIREIYIEEPRDCKTFPFGKFPCKELMEKYDTVKFLLRRIEFDFPMEDYQELIQSIYSGEVSRIAIEKVIEHTVLDGAKVKRALRGTLKRVLL